MELMETDDPIKSKLLIKTARHREELEQETRAIAERTEKIIIKAVVIGGVLALTYLLFTTLSGSTAKKSKAKFKSKKSILTEAGDEGEEIEEEEAEESAGPGAILSQVGSALISQGGVFLLSMAKEKLSEYLQKKQNKGDENS